MRAKQPRLPGFKWPITFTDILEAEMEAVWEDYRRDMNRLPFGMISYPTGFIGSNPRLFEPTPMCCETIGDVECSLERGHEPPHKDLHEGVQWMPL